MPGLVESRLAPRWTTDLIIGDREESGRGDEIEVFNPADESLLAAVPAASLEQVDRAVKAAREAFYTGPWPRLPPAERSKLLHTLADRIDSLHDALTAGCVVEIGTPITMAETMQTRGAVATLRAYAELAARDRTKDLGRHEGPIPSSARVSYLPTGVVAVITAYNIPLSIAARSMGGALAAGCTVVLLPSPRAPLTTLLMAQAAQDTGLPPGVINVVVGNADVGAALATHRGVDKVAFTGSVSVGRQIMAQAAASLKRLSLELGGKAPTVVMPGVDLEPIIYGLHARYVRNAGQGCMTPGRILVHRDDRERFVELSRGVYGQLQAGDPWERSSVLGPLIRPDHLHRVQGMVTEALHHGATVLAEGPPPTADRGWFMSPTLLGNVAPSDPIAQREIFGPVGVLLTYDDVNQAVEIANDTDYGLSADVYGTTTESAVEVASRLRSGAVVVNGGGTPRPGVPMGGFKSSGFGREGGEWGVREFLETQYVHWPA